MLLYRFFITRRITIEILNLIFKVFNYKWAKNKIKIFGYPIIQLNKNEKIILGSNIVLISSSYFSEPGINRPVIIRLLNENAVLEIGNNVGISGGGICCANKIEIGNNVMFGANAFVTDTDFHPIKPANRRFSKSDIKTSPVKIEDNVFLGMNVIVLKGSYIGENSIIAAGSIVSGYIPKNVIAGGIPAKVIKNID